MKKILLTVAVVLGINAANAQDFRFGAKAGLNIANSSMEPKFKSRDENGKDVTIGTDPIFAYHIGGVAEMKFSDKIAAQIELLYSAQGYKINDDTYEDHKMSFSAKRNYINIPVMLKYQVIEGLNVELGPQVGILAGTNFTIKENDKDTTSKIKEDILGDFEEKEKMYENLTDEQFKMSEEYLKDATKEEIEEGNNEFASFQFQGSILKPKEYIKSIDFGVNFGASYDINENINVGARYYMGLVDTRKQSANIKKVTELTDKLTGDKSYIKNGNIQVSLTYFF